MIASILGIVVGIGAGLGLMWALTRARLNAAQLEVAALRQRAEEQVATISEEAERRGRHEQAELEREAEEELTQESRVLEEFAGELDERETMLASREADVDELTSDVDLHETVVLELEEKLEGLEREVSDAVNLRVAALEERAGSPRDEVTEQLVRDRVEKAELRAQIQLRNIEEESSTEASGEAVRLMASAVDRYNGISHLERIQNTVAIADKSTLQALTDADGPAHAAFTEEIGCELVGDEESGAATVRGDDPLAREVARRVLRQIANRSIRAPDKVRSIARSVKGEVDREVQNAGRKATRQLGLKTVHPDILHLVGRLKYRLSYSQNQLKHAIEVAYLSGMLAEELGLDVAVARRGGLLHDIGKAMTHDHEGSHAVLGAEVARRCGEDEVVANAIGSHHNDEPAQGPIAYVVAAADALSGARPGARRESVTSYVRRMQDIQDIASRSPAVRRVDVMHAGREVRVIVGGADKGVIDDADRSGGVVLADAELHPLAVEIARDLEEEITFAGQIRVTVIRESRAVSIAS